MTDMNPPNWAAPEPESDGGTVATAPQPGRRRAHAGRDRVLFALRGVGQTLITAGLVILLFVVYEVWVSNIFANLKQDHVRHVLAQDWANGDDPVAGLPGNGASTIPLGTGIANLYIPRLGNDYHFTIVQGTDEADLDEGPGHYVDTALPGQLGDFAVAGHRVGKGEPFLNVDQLEPGDAIVVQTKSDWYIYRVFGDTANGNLAVTGDAPPAGAVVTSPAPQQALGAGVVGREIVDPSDGNVILPVPNKPGMAATGALMTLTTCHPKFEANKRMIVHAYLARVVPASGSALPKELSGGTL
ncbi:MAG TPA: class E sortase [Jatrophihabitantaceae bacterium]|jgi:sortase A|nr:class E sortase [Jatrophihabitantaceae bacterium]